MSFKPVLKKTRTANTYGISDSCKLQQQTKETVKIMLLQHAVRFHEARDWIHLEDQIQCTYQTLLNHCKTLEQCCEQFQKSQAKGCTEPIDLSATTSTSSSVHQDALTTQCNTNTCTWSRYSHPRNSCPTRGKECFNCYSTEHITTLCRKPRTWGEEKVTPGESPVATDVVGAPQEETGSNAEAPAAASLLIAHTSTGHHTNAKEALHHTIMRSVMFSLQDHTQGTPKVDYLLKKGCTTPHYRNMDSTWQHTTTIPWLFHHWCPVWYPSQDPPGTILCILRCH